MVDLLNTLKKKMETITTNPHVANGEPCIRDTGFTVKQLQKLLVTNTDGEILQAYPYLNIMDIQAVRELKGEAPKVAPAIYYRGKDMRIAYETPMHIPFEEWIAAYDKGVVLYPEPKNIEIVPLEEPKENPNEQNLPKETPPAI